MHLETKEREQNLTRLDNQSNIDSHVRWSYKRYGHKCYKMNNDRVKGTGDHALT